MFFIIIFFDIVLITPAQLSQVRRRRNFFEFRAIFGQKIGKNDKNLKLFSKFFGIVPPFPRKFLKTKFDRDGLNTPLVCSKFFKQEGVSRVLSTVTLTEKNFFCNRHRHRKKIFLSPSPSPKKSFLVTITVTVTVNKSFCHRHRNRWAVTVTTVFSPPVTCHR